MSHQDGLHYTLQSPRLGQPDDGNDPMEQQDQDVDIGNRSRTCQAPHCKITYGIRHRVGRTLRFRRTMGPSRSCCKLQAVRCRRALAKIEQMSHLQSYGPQKTDLASRGFLLQSVFVMKSPKTDTDRTR